MNQATDHILNKEFLQERVLSLSSTFAVNLEVRMHCKLAPARRQISCLPAGLLQQAKDDHNHCDRPLTIQISYSF